MLEGAARDIFLRFASRIQEGRLTIRLPDGREHVFGPPGSGPTATLEIIDEVAFKRIIMGSDIGLGESYTDGQWRTNDLEALLGLLLRNRGHMKPHVPLFDAFSRVRNFGFIRGRRNTKRQARHNIHAHYDLGNDFFQLFLDETMTYSCAYFNAPDEPLAHAQLHKYERICDNARLQPSDHILEIGSGWGGLAIFAAQQHGCKVTTITISEEQLKVAKQRVAEAGLAGQVEVLFSDYRDVAGEFDKIVSIEMFEAVGAEYYETFFGKCESVLKPGGLISLQTITVPDRGFEVQTRRVNWIQKYIFPGGVLPSLAAIERALIPTRLLITKVDDIGRHYAITLRRWRERFMDSLPSVRALGFDDRFIRLWEYYLAGCEASFRVRNNGDLQLVLEKPP